VQEENVINGGRPGVLQETIREFKAFGKKKKFCKGYEEMVLAGEEGAAAKKRNSRLRWGSKVNKRGGASAIAGAGLA